MSWSEAVGGYFELELNDFGTLYHDNALLFNSGRSALQFILREGDYQRIHLPYYTCDAVVETIKKSGCAYSFYTLEDDFMPPAALQPESGAALLYINYFGVCTQNVKAVSERFKNCIIDNSQAFYDVPVAQKPSFYSPRKFFGVPGGGLAYTRSTGGNYAALAQEEAVSIFSHLIERIDCSAEQGYDAFVAHEEELAKRPLKRMSRLTCQLMKNVDYEKIRSRRRENAAYLHQLLGGENELSAFLDIQQFDTPMIYPFLRADNQELRRELRQKKIYTATYWPNMVEWLDDRYCSREKYLMNNMIALPIDQRYSRTDMEQLAEVIKELR